MEKNNVIVPTLSTKWAIFPIQGTTIVSTVLVNCFEDYFYWQCWHLHIVLRNVYHNIRVPSKPAGVLLKVTDLEALTSPHMFSIYVTFNFALGFKDKVDPLPLYNALFRFTSGSTSAGLLIASRQLRLFYPCTNFVTIWYGFFVVWTISTMIRFSV